jgi:hypothetical protein
MLLTQNKLDLLALEKTVCSRVRVMMSTENNTGTAPVTSIDTENILEAVAETADVTLSTSLEEVAMDAEDAAVAEDRVKMYESIIEDEELAVHNMGAGSSLPTALEIQNKTDRPSAARSSYRGLRLVVAFLVVLSVVLGIAVGVRRSNAARSASKGSNGRNASLKNVVNYLVDSNVSGAQDMGDSNTPQYMAASWLAQQDEANFGIPSTNDLSKEEAYLFVVRYVMALLYFSTSGEKWTSQLDFLSKEDICKWDGTSKSPTGAASRARVDCAGKTALPVYWEIGK